MSQRRLLGAATARCLAGGVARCERKAEPERRAAFRGALDAHLPPVTLDDGARDVQPQAQASAGAALLHDAGDAMKAVPDVRALLHRQPRTGVLDGDERPRILRAERDPHSGVGWG